MIPSNWTISKIGARIILQRGFDITKASQNDGSVPVISSGGIASFHDVFMSLAPGVVLGRKGMVGSVFYVTENYWPHDTTLWVKDFGGEFPRFIYYFFLNMADTLKRLDVGSANPTLNRNHVHSLDAVWPPLHEQRAIAHVLGSLDDKIELNREMNRTLEDLARTVFKAWFVDFEGQTAFEEVEGRRVPQGWRVGRLGDVLHNASQSVKVEDIDSATPYVGLADMPQGSISLESWGAGEDVTSNKFKFAKGDILFGKLRPYFKKIALAPVDGVCSSDILVLKGREPRWHLFSLGVVTQDAFIDYTNQHSGGTRMPRVSWSSMADYPIALPTDDWAQRYQNFAAPLFAKIHANNEQSRTLRELRDALLPKLISGELRVRDAERFL